MKISRFRRAVPGANHVTFGRRPSRRLLLSASALAIGLALAGTGLSAPVLAAGTSTGARPGLSQVPLGLPERPGRLLPLLRPVPAADQRQPGDHGRHPGAGLEARWP